MKPSGLIDCVRRRLGVLKISLHDIRTANDNFLILFNLQFNSRKHYSDASEFTFVFLIHRKNRGCLRKSVSFKNVDSNPMKEPCDSFIERRASGYGKSQSSSERFAY